MRILERLKLVDRLSKKYTYIFLVLLVSKTYAQKNLKDNPADLTFKETYFCIAINRNLVDTIITYSQFKIDSFISISTLNVFDFSNTEEIEYLPIRFVIRNDTLFFKYQEPAATVPDTFYKELLPMRFKDTIESAFCFKYVVDSDFYSGRKVYDIDCQGDDDDLDSYRLKDTVFQFRDYRFDCYSFEQRAPLRNSENYFIRKILVDKATLIPVDVREYNLHQGGRHRRFRRYYPCQGMNTMTYHMQLIYIEE